MSLIPPISKWVTAGFYEDATAPLIDYMTLIISGSKLPLGAIEKVKATAWKQVTYDGQGRPRHTRHHTRSIRTDTCALAIGIYGKQNDCLCISGSPARLGQGNNVFGSSDIQECALQMIQHASEHLGIDLPTHPEFWGLARLDITENYLMDSPDAVEAALLAFRDTANAKETVWHKGTMYWCKGSQYVELKAYAKGLHLRQQVLEGDALATTEQLSVADHLLRLEISLRPKRLHNLKQHWSSLTPTDLLEMHRSYFRKKIPAKLFAKTNSFDSDLAPNRKLKRCIDLLAHGEDVARSNCSRATWFRIKKELKSAGISVQEAVQRHRAPPECNFDLERPVRSWREASSLLIESMEASAVETGHDAVLLRASREQHLGGVGASAYCVQL